MDPAGYIELVILVALVFLSGFFSSAETALTTVNRITLMSQAEEGDKRAAAVLKILDKYSKMLTTILVCNNIVNIAASSLVTVFALRYIGANAVSVATIILTVVVLIFGEITPKNISAIRAERISKSDAGIIRALMTVLTPLTFILDAISRLVMRIFGVRESNRLQITENEFKTYVEVGHEEGVIETEEKEIIYNALDFGDQTAKDIMVPRVDMVCLPSTATYGEVMETFRRDMFTRIPIYENEPDNIVGLINIKDFIFIEEEAFDLMKMLRQGYYTVEIKKIADLLKEMRKESLSIAFVLNEYGSTVGMITLEDVVEELVGEIHDEFDEDEEESLHKYDDHTYLAESSMKLDDINDAIGSKFKSENYDSIGGLMIEQLGRFPKNEEEVRLEDGTVLEAKGIRRNRIIKVLIRMPEEADGLK